MLAGSSQRTRARRLISFLVVAAAGVANARADSLPGQPADESASASGPVDPSRRQEERYSLHFQLTAATQYHPSFDAAYSGQNSLGSASESATAFVSTIFADLRLWRGAELLFNPEMSGGKGLSRTLGVAAFPSGIVYRVGDPAPAIYLARLAISQTFGLGGGKIANDAGPNELAGLRDRDALTVWVGRLSVADVFDGNRYAHDPTERFFNWAMFASGAWDYPADTRGYTWGVMADLTMDWWSARAGIALEPKTANGQEFDWNVGKAHGLMAEYEARYTVRNRGGAARLLVFLNQAHMGRYQQVLDDPAAYTNDSGAPDITMTRAYGRNKYGFALSADQQLTRGLGAFVRLSANDGANETWAFTEIDRSLAAGLVQDGALWHRDRDQVGLAAVASALSSPHRRYLEGGGYGFIIGDGALSYAPEILAELYYTARVADNIAASAIYQPIFNPAYNHDRGPAQILTGRVKVSF